MTSLSLLGGRTVVVNKVISLEYSPATIYVVVFNVPPTAKVKLRAGHSLVSSDRLVKQGIKPDIPGLQGERFIHYTTAAPAAYII